MKFPKNVVLELTYRCNHKCLFCSCPWENQEATYETGNELDVKEWEKAIDILLNNGVKYFSISGGEAILKDGCEDILLYIRKTLCTYNLNNEINLISNGLSISDKWLYFFKKNNIHLSLSLPGIKSFRTHTGVDNVTGVLKCIQKANSIGLKTTVNITVTKYNLSELEKNIALALLYGANDILLNRFLPGGRGLSYIKELSLTTKQINEMLVTAERVLEIANRYGNVGTEIPLCSININNEFRHLNIGYQCTAANGFFVVGPAGEIRTCNHSPKIVGHIFNNNIITDTHYWNQFADELIKIPICRDCSANDICSCGCREVASILTSNINNIDPSVKLIEKDLYN